MAVKQIEREFKHTLHIEFETQAAVRIFNATKQNFCIKVWNRLERNTEERLPL